MKKNAILKSIFFSHAGLRWGWIILFYFMIVVTSVAIIIGPALFLLSLIGLSPQPGKPVTGWPSVTGSIITLLAGYSAFLIGTHFAQRLLRNSKLSELGLFWGKKGIHDLILGIGLGTLIVSFATFMAWLMGWYQFLGFAWQFRPIAILLPAFLLSFIANIQSPLLEEVIFRGFLFQTLIDRWSLRPAIILSSILFALAHLSSLNSGFPWWAVIISTFLAGLMFAQAYLVHNSLWIPVGIHFGWVFSGRLLNDVGGLTDKTLFLASKVKGPGLIITPSGAGAGLFELFGVGLVSLFMWRMSKKQRKLKSN
jgi:membrane protease YdiL (CAAX protease family)